MKLLFFGTSDFSKPVFEMLKKEGVKPRGPHAPLRGYSPILWAGETLDDFKKLEPDICIVASYGKIIPKEWLEIPKYGFLNVHPSLLPKYRGVSPIQTAILNGDKETGVTIILMDEKVDHGPVITNKKLKIKNQNYKELEKELAELGAELLIEILPKWVDGEIKPVEQNHDEVTYTKKFSWPDGKIDWNKTAKEIDRQIRALSHEPGTWTEWEVRNKKLEVRSKKILKILEARIYDAQPYHEHEDIYIGVVYEENNQIFIPCSAGHIEPLIVQLESKKSLFIKDFVNGHQDFIGSQLK